MFAFLALSVALTTVSAQYGSGPSNNQPSSYSSNNVYYPPAVYDSHYWDYSSRERHYKQCPKLTTFVGELPGIPTEAFYPPVIRYVKYGKKVHALVSCDRDPKNFNFLFARRKSSRDVRNTHLVAVGTTAGITLKCDRDERRFEGSVVDLKDTTGDFSKQEEITQLTCMGLRETFVGLAVEAVLKVQANKVLQHMVDKEYLVNVGSRKKREALDSSLTESLDSSSTESVASSSTQSLDSSSTESLDSSSTGSVDSSSTESLDSSSTEAPIVETTDNVTEKAAETTKATVGSVDVTKAAPNAVAETTAAPESPAQQLGSLLGKIFKP